MGIDSESDIAADLVIGPTSAGMVRIYVQAEGVDLPMDFAPEEALEIAGELQAAAAAAKRGPQSKGGGGRKGGAERRGATHQKKSR